ncbi:MAG TPA: amidohydrolase family protein [Acidimicrobiales bacterium]|nr:amidohydrolase family protein [Acidimicrobiales bacterium]
MADRPTFDADNHYYEPRDCFTRHIEKEHADLALRPATAPDGTGTIALGDRWLHFPVTHYDSASVPGIFQQMYLRDDLTPEEIEAAREFKPLRPGDQDRTARLAQMDQQGLDKTLLLPTLGVCWEYEIHDDTTALYANLRAFNRWLEDDWGFGGDGRLFGVPLLTLFDRDQAVAEAERLLAAGARAFSLRPGPVDGRSVADPYFDRFWSLVDEARVPVAFHVGDAGYADLFSSRWGEDPAPNVREMSLLQLSNFYCDRPIMDTLAACIAHNLFGRFPNVTLLSLEHGCMWVDYLLHAMDHALKNFRRGPWLGGPIEGTPSEIFKAHVKVSPFPEEDVVGLVELIGAENVLFGSDYPHPEGLADPLDYAKSIDTLPEEQVRMVMHDNLDGVLARAG